MQGPVGKCGRDEEDSQQKGKTDVKSNFSHDHHCSIVQDLKKSDFYPDETTD